MAAKWSRPAKGQCMRCGFKYELHNLITEWTGLRVCSSCLDQRPQDHYKPKVRPEGKPKPGHSPEVADRFVLMLTADLGIVTADSGVTADTERVFINPDGTASAVPPL